ncbi:MAG TPA: hypothetical protein VLU46_08810, partial [Thermoanaerobaculia bacterium]|nr:hypothetical protein [Thermoanaerobaculia bacterium]
APVAAAWQDAERERIPLFADGVHPNAAGTYLAACVFYSVFYNQPAIGAEHGPVDARSAATIQRLAWSAVSRHEF